MKKNVLALSTALLSSLSLFSQTTTTIEDSNFEQALINMGIDTNGLNGNVSNEDAAIVTTLNLSSKNIKNLKGIEAFTNLNSLDVSNNDFGDLDSDMSVDLNTNITRLKISNNIVFRGPGVMENIKVLYVKNYHSGPIHSSSLNLDLYPNLELLHIGDMTINLSYQLTKVPNLKRLYAYDLYEKTQIDGQFTEIKTKYLNIPQLELDYLNVRKLEELECIHVSDDIFSDIPSAYYKNDSVIYSVDECKEDEIVAEIVKVAVYPNPTTSSFSIKIENENVFVFSVQILDTSNTVLKEFFDPYDDEDDVADQDVSFVENIDISDLPSGVYFVKIDTYSNGMFTEKLMKVNN